MMIVLAGSLVAHHVPTASINVSHQKKGKRCKKKKKKTGWAHLNKWLFCRDAEENDATHYKYKSAPPGNYL